VRDSKPGPQSDAPERVLITGGAGYIGSLLTGVLLQRGFAVTVVDDLLFGGESILAYFSHPNFRFIKGDVCDPSVLTQIRNSQFAIRNSIAAAVHLAAIVGFPACQAVGKPVAWRYNVGSVQRAFAFAEQVGAERFVFSFMVRQAHHEQNH